MPPTSHNIDESSKTGPTAGRFELCVRSEIDLSLGSLPGIGPKSVEKFASRGILTALDLLTHFPLRYNRTVTHPSGKELAEGQPEHVLFRGSVISVRKPRRGTRQPLEVVVSCDGERVVLVWFHVPGGRFADGFQRGRWYEVDGKVEWGRGLPRIVHPKTKSVGGPVEQKSSTSWVPVYPTVDGVPPKRLRSAIEAAFERVKEHLIDVVPIAVRERDDLGTVREALGALHILEPPSGGWEAGWSRSRDRLVYEEFYTLQSLLAREHLALRARAAAPRCSERELGRTVVRSLPFKLTGDQSRALALLAEDIARPVPMRRLLQGDVGSGKTVVAMTLAAIAMESGQQVALMAPTDVLAKQHLAGAERLFGGHDVEVRYLGGNMPSSERTETLARLATGRPMIVIGTHALFSADVAYGELGLVIIDEQHKFGVEQREELMSRGKDPHLLAMTATPIPRSLAHAVFGEFDLVVIKERPPGREPVRTYLRDISSRPAIYEWVASDVISAGHQAFVVFPAIEADARGFRALLRGAEEIANGPLAGHRVAVLHGQMNADDKQSVMTRFARGEFDVLCATTVIEVGVDVPNATVMVIESAEAFGLSQLHQLRGRVGRGTAVSRCVLVHGVAASAPALERLHAFARLGDGFELAEMDLVLRGPGELLGARQAGSAEFRFGDLVRDSELLAQARSDARAEVFGDVAN